MACCAECPSIGDLSLRLSRLLLSLFLLLLSPSSVSPRPPSRDYYLHLYPADDTSPIVLYITSASLLSFFFIPLRASLAPPLFLSPFAKFFSSLRGLAVSSFYRELRFPLSAADLRLLSRRRLALRDFSFPCPLITLRFTWPLAPPLPPELLLRRRPPFLFITVYFVSYFSFYILAYATLP